MPTAPALAAPNLFVPELTSERMHRAIVERDTSFEGLFYFGVTSTGVFCRPGCPARAPGRERSVFFRTPAAAMQAGFRACKRCFPLAPRPAPGRSTGTPVWAERLLERIEAHPEKVLTASDIRATGADPASASRFFKSRYGASPQALSRARRVGVALGWIRKGQDSGLAASRAGFESDSGFRKAVRELFGSTPKKAAANDRQPIVCRWLETPIGPMLAGASDKGVCLLEFIDRRALATQLATLRKRLGAPIVAGSNEHLKALERELSRYFQDGLSAFAVPLDAPGTEFQVLVWDALRQIEPGSTRSYSDIARAIGRANASRAVARANGDNRIAIIIPCHRVIGSDGSPTGYGGGVWRKLWLLEHERTRRTAPVPPAQRSASHTLGASVS